MFDTMKVPVLGVVETMSYFLCDGCTKKHYIFRDGGGRRVASEFGVSFLGEIPMEPNVANACDQGRPLVESDPQSIAARAYRDIAGAVAAQVSMIHEAYKDALNHFSIEWRA
jgi:ATP-binding protein involved in chromosome partitioning